MKLVLLAGFLISSSLFAQEDARGRITGKVQDPSGAPVPNVTVSVTEISTQVKVNATTNASGSYEVPYLDPGTYILKTSAPGFSSYERTNVEVRAADRLTIDVQLAVGSVNESVIVAGQVPLVDTSSANQGQVTEATSAGRLASIRRESADADPDGTGTCSIWRKSIIRA